MNAPQVRALTVRFASTTLDHLHASIKHAPISFSIELEISELTIVLT